MKDTNDHDKKICPDHSHEMHNHETIKHSCSHHHVDVKDTRGSRLLMTLALNFIIPVVQIVGGFYAHSMALISDATHNFSDFTAILISYVAFRIGKKGASVQNTFGYRRAEIMAALINVVILTGASAFIIYGSVHRLHHPETVSGLIVVYVAGIGILGNGISAWLLHRDSKHNLNIRSSFLHMMGDFLFSVAVLLNGLVLIYKPWYWLDPALSLLIVLFILKNCWSILKESTAVLMNATPKSLDLQDIRNYLANIPEVMSTHYLHAWNVSASSIAFSCHVVVPDQQISRTEKLAQKIRHDLMRYFQIDHPILQFETTECGNGDLLCELSCGDNGESTMNRSTEKKTIETKPWHLHRIFALLARLILGGIFIYASFDKILHPAAFATAVYNYQILPDGFINITAIVLPWLELVLGSFLIIGFWLPGTVVMSNLLLMTFTGALLFNMARGLDIGCGCFSTTAEGAVNLWTVLREVSFLIPAAYLFYVTFLSRNTQALNRGDDEMP